MSDNKETITNQFGIPDKYLEMFKASISVINSGSYFEESVREQVGKIRLKQKAFIHKNGSVEIIDVSKKLQEYGNKSIEYAKKFNEVVNQSLIQKKGQDEIDCLSFTLGRLYNDIAYMSLIDQEKVTQFVDSLKKK